MSNSRWTHVPSMPEHGGTEFDAGWQECYDTKVAGLYTALEDAITDLQFQKQENPENKIWIENVVFELLKALKDCDKK